MIERYSGYKRLLALAALSGGAAPVEDTATGNPLVFTTDLARPLKSLLIPFTPQQEGTGDPSPSNIRSILPWNGLTVYQSGADTSNPTETDISFPSPVYGGTLDVVSGVLTVEWAGFSATWGDGESATDMGKGITRKVFPMVDYPQTGLTNNMCNIAPYQATEQAIIHFYYSGSGATNRKCRLFLPSDTPDSTEVTVITKLSQIYEIQLTPQQLTALVGDNTIWSDADGSMTAVYLVSSAYADSHPVGGLGSGLLGGGFGSGSGEPDEPGEPDQPDEPAEPDQPGDE